MKALIVEKEPTDTGTAKKFLLSDEMDMLGLRVISIDTTGELQEALAWIRSVYYALILLGDLTNPDDALKIIEALIASDPKQEKQSKIILMTANFTADFIAKATATGRVHAMFGKPLSTTELRAAIARATDPNGTAPIDHLLRKI